MVILLLPKLLISFTLTHGGHITQTCTYDEFRCFLTIVDDFSRTTWTHLLATKSNGFTILQIFINIVENQFGTKVKSIRSDNALELGSGTAQVAYLCI